ncbi:MAG: hypothetical protein LBF95_09460 [Treponema sp.]|jgi:hypothetical protein|nr:hypothetical protein [Treponema sp.]
MDTKLNYTESYKWKWVCVQHPMILISRDMSEPRAAETVPPWGAESIYGYSVKMREMLQKLTDTPELKIDFDISAKELLLFFENMPDGKALMKDLIAQGRLGFCGCDYSQAHYGTARSESALRQIRMGAAVFKDQLGITTDTFQHQETGLFENLPQILYAFGIRKSAIHSFQAVFEFLETPTLEICSNFGELELIRNETMARWRGLDGTSIPIYLPVVQCFRNKSTQGEHREAFAAYPTLYEENRGLYRNGSIIVQCPDLVSIDDRYISDRKRAGDFWLLSEAIDEELKTASRLPAIRYYTYWSYAEGEFGEMMYKKYRVGEEKLLAAETMQVFASTSGGNHPVFDAVSAWDKLLTAQHHDVCWLDTRELKEWAIAGIEEAEKAASDVIAECAGFMGGGEDGKSYVNVFNTLPDERTATALVDTDAGNYGVYEDGREIPSQKDDGKLAFTVQAGGLSCKSYELREKPGAVPVKADLYREPYTFHNDLMSVTVLPDGRIASLCSKLSGERLKVPGNLIKGKLVRDDTTEQWITNEGAAEHMTVEQGPLYDKITIGGAIEDIPYHLVIRLAHGCSRTIDFELDLAFDKHEIGDFYHDETKLNIYWDLNQRKPEIVIDEPFGWIRQRPERPLLAANFVGLFEHGAGLVFGHTGTPKSWVSGSVYANLIAWGSNNFTNRFHWFWSTLNKFDMRLDRACHYRYSVSIAENDNIPAIAKRTSGRVTPLIALRGGAPVEPRSLLTVRNENLITTAVEPKENGVAVRMYNASDKPCVPEFDTPWRFSGKTDVAGRTTKSPEVGAFEIFELLFHPTAGA